MVFERLIEFLNRNRRFIITAHETPDGDAIGSEVAMMRALRRLGKQARILNADPGPANFAFLDPSGEIGVMAAEKQIPADVGEEALLVLDVADLGNIGAVSSLIPHVHDWFYVDHHEGSGWDPQHYYVDRDASSTCEILYRLLVELDVAIDFEIAEPLYVGIVYDTGSFIYPKTTGYTFEIARRLVDAGVNPSDVYGRIYESRTISFLKLQARVLATLEFHCGQAVAVQTMTSETIAECGSAYEEGQTLINVPLSAEKVRVSVFFKQNAEGLFRCSLRSKRPIDVAAIATSFRGGGHRTAAGFKLERPLEEVKAEVLQRLAACFPRAERP